MRRPEESDNWMPLPFRIILGAVSMFMAWLLVLLLWLFDQMFKVGDILIRHEPIFYLVLAGGLSLAVWILALNINNPKVQRFFNRSSR